MSTATLGEPAVYFGAIWSAVSALLVFLKHRNERLSAATDIALWAASIPLVAALTWWVAGSLAGVALPLALSLALGGIARMAIAHLTPFGVGMTIQSFCKEALQKAGGWAEWSLTEDSEVAVRIHAAGYTGHTFADTAGRGLIPETMDGLKRQQFRWTLGPVQQFMKHWRLYFGLDPRGRLNLPQKVVEIQHSSSAWSPCWRS